MTKSKKRKNYKLRRRVKRTIAALVMIMAIVVAAIPVENYGTMQAHGTDPAETIIGDKYKDVVFVKEEDSDTVIEPYENGYSGTEIIQRIVDENLEEPYKVALNGDNAIVSGINNLRLSELDVKSTEYYGYQLFDNNFRNDLKNAFSTSPVEVAFRENSSGNISSQPAKSIVDASGNVLNFKLIPEIKSIDADVNNIIDTTVNASLNISSTNTKYTNPNSISFSSKIVFQDIETGVLDGRVSDIAAYNETVREYKDIVDDINTKKGMGSSYTFTQDDCDNWNRVADGASDLNSKYPELVSLKKNMSDLTNDSDNNGQADIWDYIITEFFYADDVVDCLKGYSLKSVNGGDYYVPYLENGKTPNTTSQIFDQGTYGYLVEKKVNVVGVKSGAFRFDGVSGNEPDVRWSISLPDTIKFIGKSAFYQTRNLDSVKINYLVLEAIGNYAFSDSSFTSIEFEGSNSNMSYFGTRAFANSGISGTLNIPEKVKTIGDGCFENTQLSEVVFTDGATTVFNTTIGKYAFYNIEKLSAVTFGENNRNYVINEGAFAYAKGDGKDSMNSFSFPSSFYFSNDEDYILAGRINLRDVEFPAYSGRTWDIPDNTLCGCRSLESATFPDVAGYAAYTEGQLFADVKNDEFYVVGPEMTYIGSKEKATPRITTWKAITEVSNSVPYKFKSADGIEYVEVLDENNSKYVSTIRDEGNGEGTLIKYDTVGNTSSGDRIHVTVPGTAAGVTVIRIGKGCFNAIKDFVYQLTIKDNSVKYIDDEAFVGMYELQRVEIGDDVETIGKSAFEGCTKLENVYFSQNKRNLMGNDGTYWSNVHKIGDNAFKTGSQYLTFHGYINEEYEPYILAMSADSQKMTGSEGCQICYKTDEASGNDIYGFTVMRNRSDGKATLIDYPHYQEFDSADTDAFENTVIDGGTSPVPKKEAIENSLNLYIFPAIESVDSAAFFSNQSGNDVDWAYLKLQYTFSDAAKKWSGTLSRDRSSIQKGGTFPGKTDVQQLYSADGYARDNAYTSDIGDDKVARGGLFSGGFDESVNQPVSTSASSDTLFGKAYNGHTYVENHDSGNDYLYSVYAYGVEKLPDYAFDSCENLTKVELGANLSEIGALPFRDCKSLEELYIAPENTKFLSQNLILYRNKGDDANPDYEIIECLEGRGALAGTNNIVGRENGDLLSPISSIAKNAFSNCAEIMDVHLENTAVTEIPSGCFDRCTKLRSVYLPESVGQINSNAFLNLGTSAVDVYVPNKRCNIAIDAFDGKTQILIHGKMYENETTGELSACYKSYLQIRDKWVNEGKNENQIQFDDEGNDYVQEFVDIDLNRVQIYKVTPKRHDDGTYTDDALTAEQISIVTPPQEYTGLEFVDWMCRVGENVLRGNKAGDPAFTNIREDRMFIPRYKFNPSKVVSCGGKHRLNVVNAEYAIIDSNMITTFPTDVNCAADILLMADTKNNEGKFLGWIVTCTNNEGDFTYLFTNAAAESTGFQMPHLKNADSVVTITALFSDEAEECELVVINGNGSGFYKAGEVVNIAAYAPTDSKQVFSKWTADNPSVGFASESDARTTFVMPQLEAGSKITVTATYEDTPASGGDDPGKDDPGKDDPGKDDPGKDEPGNNKPADNPSQEKKYKLTVNYGSGSGEYKAGDTVTISAFAPESAKKVFSKWTTNVTSVGFASATSATTTFVMPSSDLTVTANYKTRTTDDDDDDDDDDRYSSTRKPGSSSTTTTVTNTTNNAGNNNNSKPGTVTNNNNTNTGTSASDSGDKIYITKNGISNKDVASVDVSGSTDNFIVRISESEEATEAVKQALINKYGTLDGISYLPMDISLYDATGKTKITDTYGLNITVTMPIPDALIQYGGNCRVAAADNGNLQQLTPKFTTIDGIACISFVPPHFSPYVIYVDTNNLVAGQNFDSTPATGDPIHPKWFLAIGMACLSVILFVSGDGRKRRIIRTA